MMCYNTECEYNPNQDHIPCSLFGISVSFCRYYKESKEKV